MEVLFHATDEDGRVILPKEQRQTRFDFLYALAVRRGMIHEQALAWAAAEDRKAFAAPARQNQQSQPQSQSKQAKPRRKRRGR